MQRKKGAESISQEAKGPCRYINEKREGEFGRRVKRSELRVKGYIFKIIYFLFRIRKVEERV